MTKRPTLAERADAITAASKPINHHAEVQRYLRTFPKTVLTRIA